MTSPSPAQLLLGRQCEVDVVRGAFVEATLGGGRLVVVAGEAGIGKSSLLERLRHVAEDVGVAVFASRALASGGSLRPVSEALMPAMRDVPLADADELQPYRYALSRLLPGWHQDAPPSPMDPTVLLGEAVLKLLAILHPKQATVLVIDDVHCADAETLALLEYLATAVRRLPVIVVLGLLVDDPGADQVMGIARRADAVVVRLTPLPDELLGQIAQQRAGSLALPDEATRFVAEQAEGLPLLAEELVDGLIRTGSIVADGDSWRVAQELSPHVPHTLAELARARLISLDASARDVVISAAVLGRTVDWTLLAAMLDLDEEEIADGIDAAVAVQLLEQAGGPDASYRWRHGLLRDAVLSQARPPEIRRLARRAADALGSRSTPAALSSDTDMLVVDLLQRSGDRDEAARRLVALAAVSIQGGALHSAEASLERALGLSSDPQVRGEISVERVRLLTLAGRARDAVASSDALLMGVDGASRDRMLVGLARAAVATGDWTGAIEFLDRVDRGPLGSDSPQVSAVRADAHYGAGRLDEARRIALAAVEDPDLADTPELLSGAYEVLARCARMEDPVESARLFQRAADVAESAGLAPARVRALFGLGSARLLMGDDFTFFHHVRELALDAGLLAEAVSIDLMIGEDTWLSDGPTQALPVVEAAAELAGVVGLDELQAMCLMMVATCHASQGDAGAARSAMDRIADAVSNPDVFSLRHVVRALDLLFGRDLHAAGTELDASIALVRDHESSGPLPHWGLWALVKTALGDGSAARGEVRKSVFITREVNLGGLQYADAIAAGRDGRRSDAVDLMDAGDRSLSRHGWWRRTLRLLVHEAAVADGWGDPVTGLRADLAGFEADGSTRQAATARDLLRAAGASVPRRGRGDSVIPPRLRALGVTSREGDVLRLVAQGLSNTDVADRLFLSVRTVETHVANLLTKTGTTQRTELAPYAAELSP